MPASSGSDIEMVASSNLPDVHDLPESSHGIKEHHSKLLDVLIDSPEIRFQAIFEQINVGICQADLDGRLVDANPGLCRMLGYTREELVDKRFHQITHPADLNVDLAQYDKLLKGDRNSMFVEKRYLHKDGHAIWVALTVCLVRDAQGQPLFSIGVSQNISDRKAAELTLQASHQHVTDILESITDAFFALDCRWRFTYINRRAEQFLNQSRRHLLGQNLWYEFPEMLGTLFSRLFRQAMTKRASIRFEEYLKQTQSWYEVHAYPTQEGLAVYFQDITYRKLAYEQIEHQIRREQALNRVIQAIRQSLDLDTIFETAAREIAHLLQADQVAIQHYDPATANWTVIAEHRNNEAVSTLLNLVVADNNTAVARRLKRLEVVELNANGRWAEQKGVLPGRWLLVPLPTQGNLPWGCLGIRRLHNRGLWHSSEIDLVKTVASQLAIAIQQAQTLERAQRELEERQWAESQLKEAQRIAHTGSWELDLATMRVSWSEEMYRIFERSTDQEPLSLQDLIATLNQDERPRWHRHLNTTIETGQPLDIEGCICYAEGRRRFVHLRGHPRHDQEGKLLGLLGTLTDISERKLIEERLFHDARHDSLTGIPNRTYFMEQLNVAVELAKTDLDRGFSVLFIDLDRFKVVNDSLGHLVGDQLLIECANRLDSVVREGDIVARLGGDEFAILLDRTPTTDEALTVAQRIHEVLQVPMVLEGQELFISASIGIASNWAGSVEAVDFLRDADTAMYQAKNSGRGCSALFDPDMHDQVATQLALESDLQRALERQELFLHYQPIIDLTTHQLVGFEALVRWHHPRWGNISPASFIPLAEETGLILSIGEWTQRTACQQLQRWRGQYPQAADLTMSVNLSVKQFGSPNLISSIDETLADTGLSYQHLHLEITESALIDNPETAESILCALQERGVQLGIDDFGTGYSSLSMVHQFPVQVLKIDRSFTHRLAVDDRGIAMVQSILALAHNLGMTAIAEGVETKEQLGHLQKLNCPMAQGYYFSKPLPASAAEQLLLNGPLG
jgi:diguanylate cyclase (GGDEF)-like protein/PAS domain S-box-containing protein